MRAEEKVKGGKGMERRGGWIFWGSDFVLAEKCKPYSLM